MTKKTIITLYQLNELWRDYVFEKHGNKIPLEVPMELTPMYPSYCRSKPTAWYNQQQKRKQQMILLEIIDTHAIDYYETTQQITSF
jgi:hypothetical protein